MNTSSSLDRARRQRRWPGLILAGCALTALTVLALVIGSTLLGAMPALGHLDSALLRSEWAPLSDQYGMLAMITGSLLVSVLALALAAPLAVILAAWLYLYAPACLRSPLRALYELLSGIPSVVYGLWGLVVLVPLINRIAPPGTSLLAASLVLALMILPYGTLIIESRLRQTPLAQSQAALAAGLSRWGSLRAVSWPLARRGALTAIVLQFGRALGETMAVLMVAGNVVGVPASVFAPVRTLTANIALEMGYAADTHRAALYLSGLLLLAIALLTMTLAREPAPHGAA